MLKVGILGFGLVGKSYLKFFHKTHQVNVWDSRELTPYELTLLKHHNATLSHQSIELFCKSNDLLALSPGIDSSNIPICKEKIVCDRLVCELDLINHKHTIAITGTLGKTSVTRLLGELLDDYSIGGNIGSPMLDLVCKNTVLELSSFQLDLSKSFAPDIAMLTNFYPNHLDRHHSVDKYLNAKLNIFRYQDSNQIALVNAKIKLPLKPKSKLFFVSNNEPNNSKELLADGELFFMKDGFFCKLNQDGIKRILSIDGLDKVTFLENWVFILAALYSLGFSEEDIRGKLERLLLGKFRTDPHRLELFATINGVDFYNDSKATVVEATFAAVEKLLEFNKQIILIIGGIGKGVDRSSNFEVIRSMSGVKKVLSFGQERFSEIDHYQSLEEVVHEAIALAEQGDQVLFSPSGASFDLFNNFQHRGDRFKEVVRGYYEKNEVGFSVFGVDG